MKRRFQLVFQSNDPDDGAVMRAVRYLLKRMLRSLNLKAISIIETTPVNMALATPPLKLVDGEQGENEQDGPRTATKRE